jgi:hypothetical protein
MSYRDEANDKGGVPAQNKTTIEKTCNFMVTYDVSAS